MSDAIVTYHFECRKKFSDRHGIYSVKLLLLHVIMQPAHPPQNTFCHLFIEKSRLINPTERKTGNPKLSGIGHLMDRLPRRVGFHFLLVSDCDSFSTILAMSCSTSGFSEVLNYVSIHHSRRWQRHVSIFYTICILFAAVSIDILTHISYEGWFVL